MYSKIMKKDRKREIRERRADPELRHMVNCLRACLGLAPLYDRKPPTDVERFHIHPAELPAVPKRAPPHT